MIYNIAISIVVTSLHRYYITLYVKNMYTVLLIQLEKWEELSSSRVHKNKKRFKCHVGELTRTNFQVMGPRMFS